MPDNICVMESIPLTLTLLPLLYFFPTSELNRQSMLCCLAGFVLSYRTIAKKIVLGAIPIPVHSQFDVS